MYSKHQSQFDPKKVHNHVRQEQIHVDPTERIFSRNPSSFRDSLSEFCQRTFVMQERWRPYQTCQHHWKENSQRTAPVLRDEGKNWIFERKTRRFRFSYHLGAPSASWNPYWGFKTLSTVRYVSTLIEIDIISDFNIFSLLTYLSLYMYGGDKKPQHT